MLQSEIYAHWAPTNGIWSNWAKPVMFTDEVQRFADATCELKACPISIETVPQATGDTCIVIDLIGPISVKTGLLLAKRGYRPVPLFNGVSAPTPKNIPLVPVMDLARALVDAAGVLESTKLPAQAPPAFLLDSRRFDGILAPNWFDNRWVVLPEDFPSANRLLAAGIRRCVLIADDIPKRDLPHVLLRYKKAGIQLLHLNLEGLLTPHVPKKPSWFGSLLARFWVMLGLRRSSAGGFGALVPEPSSNGGRSGFS